MEGRVYEGDSVAVGVGYGEVDGVAWVVGWTAVVVDFICFWGRGVRMGVCLLWMLGMF